MSFQNLVALTYYCFPVEIMEFVRVSNSSKKTDPDLLQII